MKITIWSFNTLIFLNLTATSFLWKSAITKCCNMTPVINSWINQSQPQFLAFWTISNKKIATIVVPSPLTLVIVPTVLASRALAATRMKMQKSHETASIDRNHLPKSELECSEGFELTKADLQGRKEVDRDERYVKLVVHNTQHGRRPQRVQIYIIMSIVTKKIIKIYPFKITTITQRFGERGKSGLKILKRKFYTSKKTEIKDKVSALKIYDESGINKLARALPKQTRAADDKEHRKLKKKLDNRTLAPRSSNFVFHS